MMLGQQLQQQQPQPQQHSQQALPLQQQQQQLQQQHAVQQQQQQVVGDGGGHGAMDALGAHCDDHHVVVGRMDMAPVGGLRMLDDQGEQRILYGEKPLGDDHDQTLGNGHGHAQYGVDMGNGKHGGHGHGVEDMDAKLGGLGAAMLGVEQKMEPRERQMSEGDVGTDNSPQVGKLRGRSSRDPAIEWSENATSTLLQAFGEKYRALDRGNFTSKIWADIAARVNSRGSMTVRRAPLRLRRVCALIVLSGCLYFLLEVFGSVSVLGLGKRVDWR